METEDLFKTLLIGGLFLHLVWLANGFSDSKTECTKQATVVEIVSINYREASVRLSDDTVRVVNQATLKPGDVYCVTRS